MSLSRFILCLLGAVSLTSLISVPAAELSVRQHPVFDKGWKFLLGDPADAQKPEFDDQSWRTVVLPHDWSIEGTFDPKSVTGGGEGFLPQGTAWYRHTFNVPVNWQGKNVSIEFDGVYMNCDVWINGQNLGNHPYGYTAFSYDLTPYLKFGGSNVIAVRVDVSKQRNSRWYSGCGIYRHVHLSVTNPVHIPQWGVAIQTPKADETDATIVIRTEVKNDSGAAVSVHSTLIGPDGKNISTTRTVGAAEAPFVSVENFDLHNPVLWSPESPKLYRAITQLVRDGKVIDQVENSFGVRTIAWSAANGFQLNGKTIKLCAGCVHNDNGPLGSACFDRAEERRVQLLKDAGFNAIRTSHNPPSSAFLDACDRLGMLVMDEAFDCWDQGKNAADYHLYFKDWWQRDIDSMVLRDRNHPSIVFWSVGNEIPDALSQTGADLVKPLADRIKSNDTTRPITEAICQSPNATQLPFFDVHSATLDVVGCNYILDWAVKDHDRAPSRVLTVTESFPHDLFHYWALTQDNSYVIGDCVWTALDYLGENGIGRAELVATNDNPPGGHGEDNFFPWHGAYCGDLDITGDRKPVSHYRDILWDRGEKLFMTVEQPVPEGQKMWVQSWGVTPSLPSWTWPGFEGKPVKVDVYSRYDSVELFQDGKSLGEKPTTRAQQFKATFDLTYTPGTLKIVAKKDGQEVASQTLVTAGTAATINLTPDRKTIHSDGQDLSFVTVEVRDKKGMLQPNADQEISFKIDGPGTIAAVGNGDMTSTELYQGTQRKVFDGRALVVIRSNGKPGTIHLKATNADLASAEATVQASTK
jgi:beta-galactosidase